MCVRVTELVKTMCVCITVRNVCVHVPLCYFVVETIFAFVCVIVVVKTV